MSSMGLPLKNNLNTPLIHCFTKMMTPTKKNPLCVHKFKSWIHLLPDILLQQSCDWNKNITMFLCPYKLNSWINTLLSKYHKSMVTIWKHAAFTISQDTCLHLTSLCDSFKIGQVCYLSLAIAASTTKNVHSDLHIAFVNLQNTSLRNTSCLSSGDP